jgi:hypothetical protein
MSTNAENDETKPGETLCIDFHDFKIASVLFGYTLITDMVTGYTEEISFHDIVDRTELLYDSQTS